MREYISEAIVLDKEPNGDMDIRVSFFTKKFGKLRAKAKSARKITSKLSAHLEPGNFVQMRLIEKNGLQVVDALKKKSISVPLPDLYRLEKILAEGEPDQKLWSMLAAGEFHWPSVLRILGWDPAESSCANCGRKEPEFFHIHSQNFFCESCISKEFSLRPSRSSDPREFLIRINSKESAPSHG